MIQQNQLHHFTQNQLRILIIATFHIMKKYSKWWKSPYLRCVSSKFAIFAMHSKFQTIHISKLTILSCTEWYKQFCNSMYGCWDIHFWFNLSTARHHITQITACLVQNISSTSEKMLRALFKKSTEVLDLSLIKDTGGPRSQICNTDRKQP